MPVLRISAVDSAEKDVWEHEISGSETTVGRTDDNTIALPDGAVSRHHTVITSTAQGFVIADAGSANGTWVNGKKITSHALANGDKIQVGKTMMVFVAPPESSATVLLDQDELAAVQPATPPAAPPSPPELPAQAPAPPTPPPAELGTPEPPPPPVQAAGVAAPAALQSSAASPGSLPGEVVVAGFGPRFLAYLIDTVILTVAITVVCLPMILLGVKVPALRVVAILLGTLVSIVLPWAYLIWFWARSGATPGKRFLRLQVVSEDGREPLGYGKAALRAVGYLASSFIFWIGFLMIAFTDRNRGLHDIIAGTLVVRQDR